MCVPNLRVISESDCLTSDYDPEDRCSNVDGELVSIRPEVAEKWMIGLS